MTAQSEQTFLGSWNPLTETAQRASERLRAKRDAEAWKDTVLTAHTAANAFESAAAVLRLYALRVRSSDSDAAQEALNAARRHMTRAALHARLLPDTSPDTGGLS